MLIPVCIKQSLETCCQIRKCYIFFVCVVASCGKSRNYLKVYNDFHIDASFCYPVSGVLHLHIR